MADRTAKPIALIGELVPPELLASLRALDLAIVPLALLHDQELHVEEMLSRLTKAGYLALCLSSIGRDIRAIARLDPPDPKATPSARPLTAEAEQLRAHLVVAFELLEGTHELTALGQQSAARELRRALDLLEGR